MNNTFLMHPLPIFSNNRDNDEHNFSKILLGIRIVGSLTLIVLIITDLII